MVGVESSVEEGVDDGVRSTEVSLGFTAEVVNVSLDTNEVNSNGRVDEPSILRLPCSVKGLR